MKSFVIIVAREQIRSEIREIIREYSNEFEIIAEAADVGVGKELIRRNRPDLLILDLQTFGGDPFSLLEGTVQKRLETLIISDNQENIRKSMQYRPLDFLATPLKREELHVAIVNFLQNEKIVSISNSVKAYFRSLNDCNLIQIATFTPGGIRFITLKNVIRFQKAGRRTMVKLKSGKVVMISNSMRKLQRMMMGGDFFRVGEMEIINLYEVREYQKGSKPWIQMSDGFRMPLSLKQVDKFFEAMRPIELLGGNKGNS